MSHNVLISRDARKVIRDLTDENLRLRLIREISALKDDPRPHGSLKLQGKPNAWRIRISDYRIVYTISDSALEVHVVRVAHRREVYSR